MQNYAAETKNYPYQAMIRAFTVPFEYTVKTDHTG